MMPEVNSGAVFNQRAQPQVQQIESQGIQFKSNVCCSLLGVVRLLTIIFQFAGFVSAAAVPRLVQGSFYLPSDFDDTRNAYLFFSVSGFLLSLIFYFALLFNAVNRFDSIPWKNMMLVTDVLWILSTLILAIVCAAKEGSIPANNLAYANIINRGSFASASFFGFLLSILYLIDAIAVYREKFNSSA